MSAGNDNLKRARILYVLDFLRHKSDEEHPVDAAEVINYLEGNGITAERKTIYRDISALKSFGYDIVRTHYPKNGWFLASYDFEDIEVELLADAVASSGFVFQNKTDDLLKKLETFVSDYKAQKIHNTVYVNHRSVSENNKIYYIVDELKRSIDKRKKAEISYIKYVLDGNKILTETKTYTVSPYALMWNEDHYYLICNNDKYDNLMHLRVDRIRNVSPTDENIRHFSEVSEYSYRFDTADYALKTFNMFGGIKQRIDLECGKELLNQMIDKFGKDIFIRSSNEETTFRFSTDALISEGLIGWIMQFGGQVRPIYPKELVDSVKTKLEYLSKSLEINYK